MPRLTIGSRPSLISSVIACAIVAVMIGTFLEFHHKTPPTDAVNGRYVSPCCQVLYIHDGTVTYDGQHAHLSIIRDKFGLHADVDKPLGPFYMQTPNGSKPSTLVFDGETRFTVVDNMQKEQSFTRQSASDQ